MNNKNIRNMIVMRYLYPVSVVFITIGLFTRCIFAYTFVSITLLSIGMSIAIIQVIHNFIDLDKLNDDFPYLYFLLYFILIFCFVVVLPKFSQFCLEFVC
jgi:hypothetical protein